MKKLLMIFSVLMTTLNISAQKITAHKGEIEKGYNFWFYQPTDTDSVKPLVVFLHGASLCGKNLNKVRRYGTIDAIEKGREIDAFVVAPQNPGGAWRPNKVMDIVEWAKNNHSIDTTRIYVLGMSLGGYGTIDFCATYPEKVAAGIAMCGGGTVKDYSGLTQLPMWIMHGTADRAVSVKQSDIVVKAMEAAEGGAPRLHYDRIKGMNHSALARAFYHKEIYKWLFAHSLTDSARVAAPVEFKVTNASLKAAYKDLSNRKNPDLTK
ncbi:MAG: phospholipase [Prevotella sp.]|nr:phospholipase [Prevotella sp.]